MDTEAIKQVEEPENNLNAEVPTEEVGTVTEPEKSEAAEDKPEVVEMSKDELDKIYKAKNKQRKELRDAKRRAIELEQKLAEAQQKPEPKADDFETHEDYTKAAIEYEVSKRTQTTQARPQDAFVSDLMTDGAAKYEDFDKVAFASEQMLDVLEHCEAPEDIAYYLGQNPDEQKRLHGLDNISLAREFTKIEAKLSTPQPRISSAPPPPKPLEEGPTTEVDESKLSMDEWAARRNKVRWEKGKI